MTRDELFIKLALMCPNLNVRIFEIEDLTIAVNGMVYKFHFRQLPTIEILKAVEFSFVRVALIAFNPDVLGIDKTSILVKEDGTYISIKNYADG